MAGTDAGSDHEVKHERWYKYGIAFIFFEAGIAVAQTIFALYMTLSGAGGLGGH